MAGDGKTLTPNLTNEQRLAITTQNASIALSAGAGCGKTFVLTERFLSALDPQGDDREPRLSQLIAITFTERAAREMRQRIRAACQKRLAACSGEHIDYWLGLIRELDSARISTIHSFCASLLRAHAVEAGLNPRFNVLDRAQADILLLQLTDDVLRSRLASHNEATLALAAQFSLDRLRDMVARLLAARHEIDWDAWQHETPAGLVARWAVFWQRDTLPRLLRKVSESAEARTVVRLAERYPPDHPVMRQRCDLLCERLSKLGESRQPAADLAEIREAAKVQGGGTKKNWASEDIFAQFRDAAKALRDTIDNVKGCLTFDRALAEPAATKALQVFTLAADVATQYQSEKHELDVLDFNDLLVEARNLLVGRNRGGLRKRLASQIRLLLVDEFQDTDPLQVALVKALCNDEYLRGKLFLVGDYKQSIYRFRGANPHVFRDLRAEIPAEGQLPLSLNFRSQPAVLDFVNALFCDELGPDYQPLRAHRQQISPTPAIEFLWACPDLPAQDVADAPPDNNQPQRAAAGDAIALPDDIGRRERLRRCEADWIARRIRAMLDSGIKLTGQKLSNDDRERIKRETGEDPGEYVAREARQGDFVLLFRALTNVEFYEEALRRYGIDYYLVGGHAFYSQQEVYDVLNLLRAINSPGDDVSLFGVLRSPMFGLNDETLFWLFLDRDDRPGSVFGELPEEIDEPQRGRAVQSLATIRELQAAKDRLPIAELIHEALRRTGYDAVLLAEFLGERKLANLHKLIEQARSFDRAGIFTLTDFITQLAEFVASQPDEALAATNPESMDVVRLMSIHQSKGLEFPVVILPDIDRPRMAQGPSIAFHHELGPVLKDANAATGYDFLMAQENEEDLAELSRLFYVATTRAADYLILSAGVEQPVEPHGPWLHLLARHFDLSKGEPIQADGPHVPKVAISVTMSRPVIGGKPADLHPRRDLKKIVEKAQKMAAQGEGSAVPYLGPVAPDATARRQYSFSRLSGTLQAHLPTLLQAAFEDETPTDHAYDSRGLGTLVHAALEEINFAQPGDIEQIVERLASQHVSISPQGDEPQQAIDMLGRLIASPRARQLAAAPEVHRELEFLLAWPPGAHDANSIYLQGFIDCLYRDAAGQWRLLDYKTNRVTAKNIANTAAVYEMQMLVYGLAAETILKVAPAELTLCFLRPGIEHGFAWDDRARQRAVELVNAALADSRQVS